MRFDPINNSYKFDMELKYDPELGELHDILENEVKRVVKIRAQLENELIIKAVIFELEKRGYTVISPEEDT